MFAGFIAADREAVGSVELDPAIEAPAYHAQTEWHLEPGGWDGYDLYGPLFAFAVGPHVSRHGGYAAVGAGADITQHPFVLSLSRHRAFFRRRRRRTAPFD